MSVGVRVAVGVGGWSTFDGDALVGEWIRVSVYLCMGVCMHVFVFVFVFLWRG